MKELSIAEWENMRRQLPTCAANLPHREQLDALIVAKIKELAEPIIFKSINPTRWEIGRGEATHYYTTDLLGLSPAWLALSYHHDGVRLADLVTLEAARPDNSIRNAIGTLIVWLEHTGRCPALAVELRKIEVTATHAIYHPDAKSPKIITGVVQPKGETARRVFDVCEPTS